MRSFALAMLCLIGACAASAFRDVKAPDISPREEGKRILAIGALELVGGTALTFGGYYAEKNPGPSTSTMIPGTEGQGLSGDGLYDNGGGGFAGLFGMAIGAPLATSGAFDVAQGIYEIVTDRYLGGRHRSVKPKPVRRSCVGADMNDEPCH